MRTREGLIQAAYELFSRNGFHAVGIDQIIMRVGVTKRTFYNHFESKDAIILEVIRWHANEWSENLRARLRAKAGDHPRDQLLALMDVLDESWGTEGYRGCLFGRAIAEFPWSHHPIHGVVSGLVRAVATTIRELAEYAGAKDPETVAEELLLIAAGANRLTQMQDPVSATKAGKRMAAMVVNGYLPRRKSRRSSRDVRLVKS